MNIVKGINNNIFREYDIRGTYNIDLNEDIAYTIGKAFGTKLRRGNISETIVGYDNRYSSPMLFEALIKGITETGINIINVGLVTTPMYYFALTYFKMTSGMMITASHNPKDDNGFKLTFNGKYNACGLDIKEFKELVDSLNFESGNGIITNKDIKEQYLDYITSSIKLGSNIPKMVVDCGNGTASIIIKDVFNKLNVPFIPLFCESDSSFPNHHPDPAVEANLAQLKAKVLEEKADIGFAYDGDADRIGMVDEYGHMINVDLIMIIFIRNIINNLTNKKVLYDVKCSKALEDEIIKLGGTPICYRTGNSYLRKKIYEDNLPFGGELSGHIFFNDKFYGFDDGIYASLRMLEILSNTDKKVSELLDGVEKYYSTTENKIAVTDDNKCLIVNDVIKYCNERNYNILTIDGCKVLFNDGFALIRASNTGPNLTTRFEALSEERLLELETEFNNLIDNIKSRY